MKTVGMFDLLSRAAGEWSAKGGIYEIGELSIRRALALESASPGFDFAGKSVPLPVGPAAGPHTQLAPNLVAAYLAGARVFELKTVQENDRLDIEKPCIDALDEGQNTEWSTELPVPEALGEYLRAYAAITVLGAALSARSGAFAFNASVGYTLDGIRSPKIDAFLEGLRKPSGLPAWEQALSEAERACKAPSFSRAFGSAGTERSLAALEALTRKPTGILHSVSLSTMHGCPPAEIERIARYLLLEKGLDTYVKLNPTLLGYDRARAMLDRLGWERIRLDRHGFEADLQMEEALALIRRLRLDADGRGLSFGLKLSNTLANANDGGSLPGKERYMSGRALFPLIAELAAQLARAMEQDGGGACPFSFSAGINQANAYDCLRSGLGPLTMATELLKPGGYLRLEAVASECLRAMIDGLPKRPQAEALADLASLAMKAARYQAEWKKGTASIKGKLPLTDCFAAPCVQACAAKQNPPAYMRALADGQATEALSYIMADNPLPTICGVLCDHRCQDACSRADYEGPVRIRDMKLAAARLADIPPEKKDPITGKGKAAIIGSGPAGLSCAHYLALEGYPVCVFERSSSAGGVPANVIPSFRIAREDLARDIDRVRRLGADFVFGWHGGPRELKELGFDSVVLAFGASSPKPLELPGSGIALTDALDFLARAMGGSADYGFARHIVVVGGGNTAMDAARQARRLPHGPEVTILYRRTVAQMPADREEFEAAIADGVLYRELSQPHSAHAGFLRARDMELGKPGPDGRAESLPTDRFSDLPCDLVISALGEAPDAEMLAGFGLSSCPEGKALADPVTMQTELQGLYLIGDARRGPASIIAAAADGRAAAYAILRAHGLEPRIQPTPVPPAAGEALSRRGWLLKSSEDTITSEAFLKREADRCLSCASACLRCVEVCPNRANVALPVEAVPGGPYAQGIQILHLDALCNECGNCVTFCPWEGKPHADKATLYNGADELKAGGNPGFAFLGELSGQPDLAIRDASGAVRQLDYWSWTSTATARDAALLAMARTLLTRHAYLLGGRP